jgi:hypothetical protein
MSKRKFLDPPGNWILKPEWWGAPLVQEEKYQGTGNCDKMMMIIIICLYHCRT